MTLFDSRALMFSRFVLTTVFIFTTVGAAVSYGTMVSYKSRSIVSFNGSISDFRILQEQVNSTQVLDRYVLDDKTLVTGGAAVRGYIVNVDSWIDPIFRLNKK